MQDSDSQIFTTKDVDQFLANGFFMGQGLESVLVAWGKIKKLKSPPEDQISFYLNDFYLGEKTPWLTFSHTAIVKRSDFSQMLTDFCGSVELDLKWQKPRMEHFSQVFSTIQMKIKSAELNKAVPVVFSRSSGTMTKAMRARMVKKLLSEAVKPTPYGFLSPSEGILGASPEFLFSYDVKTHEMVSMALAGTRSSELEKTQSLLNDEKEIFEHELVVRGLKEKLKTLGERSCSPTYVWDLGTLAHLRTDIQVEIVNPPAPQKLFQTLIELLHPTAALGVSPVQSNWRILKELEGEQGRARFGAPFGVFNPKGKSQVLVAIRNLQWDENGLFVGSGCGVVAASDLQNEWRELELKQKYVFALLNV